MHIVNICLEDSNSTIMGCVLCLAAGEDLQWFSLVQPPTVRQPSQHFNNNYFRNHILFKEHIGSWVHACFKPLEGRSSKISYVCLCVIDRIYLLVVHSTFRNSAGYILFTASIFCCLRTYVVFMAGKHKIGWDVCVRSDFCNKII